MSIVTKIIIDIWRMEMTKTFNILLHLMFIYDFRIL